MRRLVGGEDVLSESSAAFYLEMSNWNVSQAVGHYFDLQVNDCKKPLLLLKVHLHFGFCDAFLHY
jgi:UBA-like domain